MSDRTDARRWEAVLCRDAGQDGEFVYAVESTGIFCRPSCPSRRPRRDRVRFFPSSAQAKKAGFRPCRRCQPEASAAHPDLRFVRRITGIIRAGLRSEGTAPKLSTLGRELGLSPFHLQRRFKKVLGISPRQYADSLRFKDLKKQLKKGKGVTESLYESGFGSSSRLYENSDRRLGMTPAAYGKGGLGMDIRFDMAKTGLGSLLVARTQRGICAVDLADKEAALLKRLRQDYPRARLRRDQAGLRGELASVAGLLDGRRPGRALSTDLQGTAFQCRVWDELSRIPSGKTRTYSEVAKAIGRARAVRAVASACARNPVPLIIPCHRVVRKGGGLGGYALGVDRKKAILAAEAAGV